MRRPLSLIVTAVLLAGCGSSPTKTTETSPDDTPTAETVAAPAPAPPEQTQPAPATEEVSDPPTIEDEVSESPSPTMPSRDEMDEHTLKLAESTVVAEVRKGDIAQLYTDDEIVAGAHVACDAWDGGKPLRGVLVDIAEELPSLESTDAVAELAGIATGILCPEYLPTGGR